MLSTAEWLSAFTGLRVILGTWEISVNFRFSVWSGSVESSAAERSENAVSETTGRAISGAGL